MGKIWKEYFKEIPVTNKYIKRYSASFIYQIDIQVQTIMKYNFVPVTKSLIKAYRCIITSVDQGMEHSYIVGRSIK